MVAHNTTAPGSRGDSGAVGTAVTVPRRAQRWLSRPSSALATLAVVLATSEPARPTGDGHAEARARADTLPARHTLGAGDTSNSLSRRYYGSRGGPLAILWRNGLKRWPPSKRIVASERYRVGDTIVIPQPPSVSINPPQPSRRDGHETVASRNRKP